MAKRKREEMESSDLAAQNGNQDLELKLIEAARGEGSAAEAAKAELVSKYSNMIHKIVVTSHKYAYAYDEYPDMFNEGVIAFLRAVEKFDPEKASLATYAYMWIQQAIKRYVSKHSGHMRLSPDKYRMVAKVLKMLSEDMTHTEVAEALDISMSELNSVLRAKIPMMSLDAAIAEESQALIDSIAGDQCVEREAVRDISTGELRQWMDHLEPADRKLLSLRYDRGLTYEEIATIMNSDPAYSESGKVLKRGRIMTMCEKAEKKLHSIAQREAASKRSVASTSMFARPVDASKHQKDDGIDMSFDAGIKPVSG